MQASPSNAVQTNQKDAVLGNSVEICSGANNLSNIMRTRISIYLKKFGTIFRLRKKFTLDISLLSNQTIIVTDSNFLHSYQTKIQILVDEHICS